MYEFSELPWTGMLTRCFYNCCVVPVLWLLFRLLGLVSPKAARGLAGRRDLFGRIARVIDTLPADQPRVWFHSSSMGEFEQAKPIIAELKRRMPGVRIVVSFFSASGYEHSLRYTAADLITYIPFDSFGNAKRFVAMVRPAATVVIRYDVWPNHLWALRRAGVPVLLSNATMKPGGLRSVPVLRSMFRTIYNDIDFIFPVSAADEDALRSFGLPHPSISRMGDTRYDQVLRRSRDSASVQLLAPEVTAGKRVIVAGSTWPEDEAVLLPACRELVSHRSDLLIILVPHEPTPGALEQLEESLGGERCIRFSALSGYRGEQYVLVDSIGILMTLYRYADLAFVGGSFHQGIHNVLEPAVYGIPVLFGPVHQNSQEAGALVAAGGAVAVSGAPETVRAMADFLGDEKKRRAAGAAAKGFVTQHAGATDYFVDRLIGVLRER